MGEVHDTRDGDLSLQLNCHHAIWGQLVAFHWTLPPFAVQMKRFEVLDEEVLESWVPETFFNKFAAELLTHAVLWVDSRLIPAIVGDETNRHRLLKIVDFADVENESGKSDIDRITRRQFIAQCSIPENPYAVH